jgi:NADH-quinone oxidoreductase subunit F
MSKNLRGISARSDIEKSLFDQISEAGGLTGEERTARMEKLAYESLTGEAHILGVSSFYDFTSEEHNKRKVLICDGSACLTSGSQDELRNTLEKYFEASEIGTITCLGLCHSNHAFMYDGKAWSAGTITEVEEIIKNRRQTKHGLKLSSNVDSPLFLNKKPSVKEYYSVISKSGSREAILEEIKNSGLRGRGGAGFPFHLKLANCIKESSNRKYVVCNADEGDPGAFSDKFLLEENPHAVLSGMIISGFIAGADTGILYIRGEYPESYDAVRKAIGEYESLFNNSSPFTGDFRFKFKAVKGQGAYVCGEETSLLNSLEGLRPEVRTRPPFPTAFGLFGKPTILSNVETFANLPAILERGAESYASLGTSRSTGTKLVCLDGVFRNPGLLEIEMGTPMNAVLNEMGGGTKYPVKAFQVGGPLGGIIPADKIDSLSLDFESFAEAGFLLGHASIVSIPESFRMIDYLHHLFSFTSKESCGKCFPCRLGSMQGANLVSSYLKNGNRISKSLFMDLVETMQAGSLCALGGGLPLPVRNIIDHFGNEIADCFEE